MSIWDHYRGLDIHPSFKHRQYDSHQFDYIFHASDLATSLDLFQRELRLVAEASIVTSDDESRDADYRATEYAWLALRLLRDKIHSQRDVSSATALLSRSLSSFPIAIQPSLLVMCMYWASRFRAESSLDELLTMFLNLDPDPPTFHYHLLLCVLAGNSRSKQTTTLIKRVLDVTLERDHEISQTIYITILRPGTANCALADIVAEHMDATGFIPADNVLLSFMRIYFRGKQEKKAAKYFEAIRARRNPDPALSQLESIDSKTNLVPSLVPDTDQPLSHQTHSAIMGQAATALFTHDIQELIPSLKDQAISLTDSNRHLQAYKPNHPYQAQLLRSLGSVVRFPGTPLWIDSVLEAAASHKMLFPPARLAEHFSHALLVSNIKPREIRSILTVVISHLMRRSKSKAAAILFRQYRDTGGVVDIHILGVGIRALVLGGYPIEVIRTIEDVYRPIQDTGARRLPARKNTSARDDLPLSVRTVCEFMQALSHIQRADVVFTLWDNMELLYNVLPDSYTFHTLMHTACQSKQYTNSLRGVVARLRLDRFMNTWTGGMYIQEIQDPRERVLVELSDMLSKPQLQTGLWHGRPAYQAGLCIATHVLLSKWPGLVEVQNPMQALRHGSDSVGARPWLQYTHTSESYRLSNFSDHPSRLLSFVGPPPNTQHRTVVQPSELTFLLYLRLVAANNFYDEIPLVFAWMRFVGLRPQKEMIATALVYWRTVASDAPLIETMKGGGKSSPYEMFERWLLDWVGVEGMPSEGEIGKIVRATGWFDGKTFRTNPSRQKRTGT